MLTNVVDIEINKQNKQTVLPLESDSCLVFLK
jgi:hypothetical protein